MTRLYLIAGDPHFAPSAERLEGLVALLCQDDVLRPAADGDGYEGGQHLGALLDIPTIAGAVYEVDPRTGERSLTLPDPGRGSASVRMRLRVHDRPEPFFPDAGRRALCPTCRTEVSAEAWRDAMARFEASGRRDLSFICPACAAPSSLNDLDFRPPGGFARFALAFEAESLSCYNLGLDLLERIENEIDCALREVSSAPGPASPPAEP